MYFEKYVKGKMGQTLWIRNLQLSIYGVPLAFAYSLLKDGRCAALFRLCCSLSCSAPCFCASLAACQASSADRAHSLCSLLQLLLTHTRRAGHHACVVCKADMGA